MGKQQSGGMILAKGARGSGLKSASTYHVFKKQF